MQETNYCAHAIDGLKQLINVLPEGLAREASLSAIGSIKKSIKFRIPDFGKIFHIREGDTLGNIINKYIPSFRLPYPVIALEFANPSKITDAEVCIIQEQIFEEELWIVLKTISRVNIDGKKLWVPRSFGAAICCESLNHVTFKQMEPEFCTEWAGNGEYAIESDLTILVQFLAALSCSNSATADAPDPNPSLNAKRKSSGKTPFFSYKTLTISASESHAKGSGNGGAHSSPRVHLRRGHIRRLTDRTVWVNSCVVGDKSKGMVVKDYQVTA